MSHTSRQKHLYEQARIAIQRAYNPYSHYGVGAALYTDKEQTFIGCNIENVSYGLTICAERSAIAAMISTLGHQTITDLLIIASGTEFPSPCGACRQVIAEFATPETTIHLARANDKNSFDVRTYRMAAILPLSFTQQIFWGKEENNTSTKKDDVVVTKKTNTHHKNTNI